VIEQATVLFDPGTGETRAMRTKEDAHDYRYFPDPDLLPLEVSEQWLEQIKTSMPELPQAKRHAFISQYALTPGQAALLTANHEISTYSTRAFQGVESQARIPHIVNWITGALSAKLNEEDLEISQSRVKPEQLVRLDYRVADGTLSGKMAKEVFDAVWAGEGDPDAIIEKRGLRQISDSGEIERIVDQVIAANAQQVADYKGGKEKAFNSLVGQAMKLSKGKANPQQVSEILKRKLAG
jgi:aspartyl-tRNA(Asn)/glutamyl-tRNA(Gln) amidotransferase subunit B